MRLNDAKNSTELAVIDILFARAELVAALDADAITRALEHIDSALAELMPHAPCYDPVKIIKAA